MEYISADDAHQIKPVPSLMVWEYQKNASDIGMCVTETNGRFPESGYLINHECAEMCYVTKGSGALITESGSASFKAGDMLYIPAGEKIYWEGEFTLVVACSPAWFPEQHEHLNE